MSAVWHKWVWPESANKKATLSLSRSRKMRAGHEDVGPLSWDDVSEGTKNPSPLIQLCLKIGNCSHNSRRFRFPATPPKKDNNRTEETMASLCLPPATKRIHVVPLTSPTTPKNELGFPEQTWLPFDSSLSNPHLPPPTKKHGLPSTTPFKQPLPLKENVVSL